MQIPEIARDRLDAAITYLNDEIEALKQAETPETLSICLEGIAIDPPLPSSQFEDIISQWKFLPVPKQLIDTATKWKQSRLPLDDPPCDNDTEEENIDETRSFINQNEKKSLKENESAEANGETSGLFDTKEEITEGSDNATAHRKNVMLDILSKIISVAASKGFKLDNEKSDENEQNFISIQIHVEQNQIHEWDIFTHLIYEYCQQLIGTSKTDAREKGLELFHFARTLTESLRHISAQRENELVQITSDTPKERITISPSEHETHIASEMASKAKVSISVAQENKPDSDSKSDPELSERKRAISSECLDDSPRSRKRRRKRKAVVQATRMSSRQQKRRAQIAENMQTEDCGKSESSTGAEEENIEEPLKQENGIKKGSKVDAPVLLTKTGRPRKKPGRKPGKRKH
uniref:Uncharacterized protein AlNc14C80G5269 n=1 Tax=Albugo laibachii Nc14 TaxID=890382 RepID=F0WF75_9STRA|nr:conserved hypothetical protein [Albugo laibachii Nc14]|eukprot:CCA19857.1 conserved hypothetical protein [Albugo laibachii Nc14]